MKRTGLTFLAATCGLLCSFTAPDSNVPVRIAKYKGDKIAAISYTFDDGLKEHYTMAAPELEKRGFRGTFWVWGLCIDNDTLVVSAPRMSSTELRDMSVMGHEISNHSWSHLNLSRIPFEEAKREIQKNDTVLFGFTGVFPRTFCYPFNALNKQVLEFASRERVGTRTSQVALGSRQTPEGLDRRLDELLETGGWDVTMTHGISIGYDAFRDPQVLWDYFDKVKALEERIWVGTFREVAAYTRERDEVKLLIIVRKEGSVRVVPELELDKDLFDEPLTMILDRAGIKKITVKQDGKKLPARVFPDKVIFDFDPFGGDIYIKYK